MQKNTNNYDLNQLKQEIKLVDLATKDGIKLKKMASGEYTCLCPFHDDKTPSLHINAVKNVFHCKGCGASGSNIDWIKNEDNVTESQAIKILTEMAPTLFKVNGNHSSLAETKPKIDITKPEYQKLFMLVLGYYHNRLKETKDAISFLMRRGLKAGELLEKFQVGYCSGDLLSKLSLNDTKQIQMLKDMGLLNDKGNERFYRCVIFPLLDIDGNVVQIYGRSISSENASKHNLLPSSLAGIFNKWAFQSSELFICESVIDVLSLMQLGITNVTSTLGVGGITRELLDKVSQSDFKKIYICFDNDKAGNDGAVKLTESLKEFGCDIYRIEFEKSKDANDLLRRSPDLQSASRDFKILIENATTLFQLRKEESTIQETTATTTEQAPIESYKKVGNELQFYFGPRGYIVRGLEKNTSDTSLKIFLKITLENRFHIDNSLDLFNPKTKTSFIKYAAIELEINQDTIKGDLGKLLITLDSLLQKQIEKKKEPEKKQEYFTDIAITYKARKFLETPLFIVEFIKDVNNSGIVGENLNVLFGFIATVSKILPEQLNIIVQAESSSGKSTVVNLISSFVPPEQLHYFTQITPKSFYYMAEDDLWEMCIAVAEAEGLEMAIYPIKQMISEKILSIVFTKTDPKTGEHTSSTNSKKVKVQIMITAPKEGLDEELENRCVILTLDESLAQTQRVQEIQRKLKGSEGEKIRKKRKDTEVFYQHVQREIKPVIIANDYYKHLIFSSKNQRARRDNQKYLTLIESITLLFQYQSERTFNNEGGIVVKTNLIHIAIAHFLMRRVFHSTLDELPAQTRNLLTKIINYVLIRSKEEHTDVTQVKFTRKQIKKLTGLSMNRVHEHVMRLMFNEYLLSTRDANGFAYRLNFRPDEDGEMVTQIELVSMKVLFKVATLKEKNDYENFKPYLVEIFKALDPTYDKEKGEEL